MRRQPPLPARVSSTDAEPDDGPESASPAPLEGYLSSPAAKELLRAIRGRGLRRLARDAAALTIAAVIAGMAIAWLRGDAPPAVTEGIDAPARVPTRPGPNPAPDVIASPAAGAGIESTPEVAGQDPRAGPRCPIPAHARFATIRTDRLERRLAERWGAAIHGSPNRRYARRGRLE